MLAIASKYWSGVNLSDLVHIDRSLSFWQHESVLWSGCVTDTHFSAILNALICIEFPHSWNTLSLSTHWLTLEYWGSKKNLILHSHYWRGFLENMANFTIIFGAFLLCRNKRFLESSIFNWIKTNKSILHNITFISFTKSLLPNCHYQIVVTKLSLPKIRPS